MDALLVMLLVLLPIAAIGALIFYVERAARRRKQAEPPSPLPGILFLIGGGVLLLVAVSTAAYTGYFLAASESTTARVTAIVDSIDKEGATHRHPVFDYTDAQGKPHQDRATMSGGREFRVGDVIPIRYLSNSPHEARIDYFEYHWLLSIALFFGALLAVGCGWANLWWYRRRIKSAAHVDAATMTNSAGISRNVPHLR